MATTTPGARAPASASGSASGANALAQRAIEENRPIQKLYFYRLKIQKIHRAVTAEPDAHLTSEQSLQLQEVLREISQYDFIANPGDLEQSRIDKSVKTVTDPQIFPDQVTDKAKLLLRHWEEGKRSPINLDAEDDLSEFDENEGIIGSDTDGSLFGEDADSRPRSVSAPAAGPPDPPATAQRGLTDPANTSKSHLLRGISITYSASGRKTYKLDPDYPKRRPDVFGNNGLAVGDWWPFQICTLRDGAHGATMAGISGKLPDGAISVVISGGTYDDQDQDNGDVVWYSGSMGPDTEGTKRSPQLTMGVKCLLRTERSGRKLRVLRTGKSQSRWSPSVGLRYDGLYKVTSHRTAQTNDGRWYYQFKLERCADQEPINMNRPTPAERNAFSVLTSGR